MGTERYFVDEICINLICVFTRCYVIFVYFNIEAEKTNQII